MLKKLVNQKTETQVHTHGYGDLIKVIITTLSIILFNLEDNVTILLFKQYFKITRAKEKARTVISYDQFYSGMAYLSSAYCSMV